MGWSLPLQTWSTEICCSALNQTSMENYLWLLRPWKRLPSPPDIWICRECRVGWQLMAIMFLFGTSMEKLQSKTCGVSPIIQHEPARHRQPFRISQRSGNFLWLSKLTNLRLGLLFIEQSSNWNNICETLCWCLLAFPRVRESLLHYPGSIALFEGQSDSGILLCQFRHQCEMAGNWNSARRNWFQLRSDWCWKIWWQLYRFPRLEKSEKRNCRALEFYRDTFVFLAVSVKFTGGSGARTACRRRFQWRRRSWSALDRSKPWGSNCWNIPSKWKWHLRRSERPLWPWLSLRWNGVFWRLRPE